MNNERSFPAVGGCSLLVIFAVLCLTVFALLGLASVQSEDRLATASHEAVTAYYDADCQAEEILARLRSGETVPEADLQAGVYTYVCPISDTQELRVQVEAGSWTVLQWQAAPVGDWEADTDIDVWDGEMPF